MSRGYLVLIGPDSPAEKTTTAVRAERRRLSDKSVKIISLVIYLLLIPAVIAAGVLLLNDRKYNIVSIIIAFLACIPFFIGFENGKSGARELVVIAVMSALSVLGRLIFAPVPSFKPVTAIVIITGAACGMQAGFITGAVSAMVSNIMYGQGPWMPFQMLSWGLIGLLAGLIMHRRRNGPVTLIIAGIIGGVLFSMLMDVWTVLSLDGKFSLARYGAAIITALPTTAVYIISNCVFLLILYNSFKEKLDRINTKFGLFGRK